MDVSEKVAKALLDIGAVSVAPLEGPYFPYSAKPLVGMTYIDCRMIISHDELKEELAQLMKQQVGVGFDAVFGSTTAGMSPAENLSRVSGPESLYYYIRAEKKDYGVGNAIEGNKKLLIDRAKSKGMISYVIAEDLINNGKNLGIIDGYIDDWLSSEGIKVNRKVLTAFVTYDKPEVNEWITQAGYENQIMTTVKQVIELGPELSKLTIDQRDSALEFLRDSTKWREARGLPTKSY
jgi:orotate phosphoribosyltransferase